MRGNYRLLTSNISILKLQFKDSSVDITVCNSYNIYTFHHLIIDSSMQRCFSKNLIREQQNACVIGNVPFYSLYLHSCGWLPCRLPQSEHPAHNKSLPPPASLPKILYWLQKQYKLELLYEYSKLIFRLSA